MVLVYHAHIAIIKIDINIGIVAEGEDQYLAVPDATYLISVSLCSFHILCLLFNLLCCVNLINVTIRGLG